MLCLHVLGLLCLHVLDLRQFVPCLYCIYSIQSVLLTNVPCREVVGPALGGYLGRYLFVCLSVCLCTLLSSLLNRFIFLLPFTFFIFILLDDVYGFPVCSSVMAGICFLTAVLIGIYMLVDRCLDYLERRRCAAFHLQRKAAIASWRLDSRHRDGLPCPSKRLLEESASLTTGSLQYSLNYGTHSHPPSHPNLQQPAGIRGVIDETAYVNIPAEDEDGIPSIAVSV